MTLDPHHFFHFWQLLTRLGEMQILLPAALFALALLIRRPDSRQLAFWWILFLLVSTLVTTASKVAFIGWGLGSAEFNFTGFSGHAMFAAAIYPLLLGTLASHASPAHQRLALAGGWGLALLVGISRIVVGAHSLSEVMAGLLLGGAVSACVIALAHLPRAVIGPVVPVLVAVWLLVMPIHAPPLETHGLVTWLSLKLSGHQAAYTREDLLGSQRRS